MLCLPVFIILLLLASPAAPKSFETKVQSDLTRTDGNMETEENLGEVRKVYCCLGVRDDWCCAGQIQI
uniref:Conotoxin Lt5.9 n=1 Tax=Conus litteratus TaxID=89445 RepID=CT59_CONLT|nr:RecName: Full=Conotoxin Lt5.9; AltName: Full=Lt5i; Flags: Precursor [Conus litteratus]ABC70193.1 T-superfamily conotoxin lt5i precursor [Conus litteratus]